ncbi:MAG: class A beta-lactamase-related serine hydrolase [Heliobacteriaceae bacterium]|nr:class A beta-lactamase-related serine hydrolase [Heliobacteriaceae bacterium]
MNGRLYRKILLVGLLLPVLFLLMIGNWYYFRTQFSNLQFLLQLAQRPNLDSSIPVPDYQPLQDRIQERLPAYGGDYGIYVEDLLTGSRFGIRDTQPFPAASIAKVPLVLFVYALAIDGRIDLEEKLTLTRSDLEPGAGGLKNQPLGSTYSLRQLAKYCLEDSDNTATKMLMRRVGRTNFYVFLRITGAQVIPLGPGKDSLTCARDTGLYLKGIWVLQQLHPDYGREIMQNLINSKYNDRIPAGIPDDIKVANKTGWQTGIINDAAIVLLTGRPYILVVLSHHTQEKQAITAINFISRIVFQFQQSHRIKPNPFINWAELTT